MDAAVIVALGSAVLAAVVAVVVPIWTFRKTLEQDRIKWVRDQRAQLYVNMLIEAHAEKVWFLGRMTKVELALIESEEGDGRDFSDDDRLPDLPDVRLAPMDRAKLGARGSIFASPKVAVAFNKLQGHMQRATLLLPGSSGEAHIAKFTAEKLFDDLQAIVRREVGACEIELTYKEEEE
ncbi:hypothetical protein [Phytohabitans aurantiacus]|uniref:Uncharacterized protein n=1 Tax=Phytohabitans aurantiacus TaxID=3016789 RepID=A0ABQ5R2D3_9ACTN|nr:hypothetical protein [Phytohabitans aurantiacus]GLI00944.1 hypothetical protein Pa4123_62200 [Phytohabitans aurantiacus]